MASVLKASLWQNWGKIICIQFDNIQFNNMHSIWREKNRLRNLDLREEGRNLNISGKEEIENSFKSELRSLKSLVAV